MTDSMLREVDEALRADRLDQFWAKHRATLLFCALAIVLATAGASVWKQVQEKRGGALLERFTEAQAQFEAGKLDAAAAQYGAIAKDTHGEVADLAHLWQARALISADKPGDAIPILKATSEMGSSLWSDIACLRLAGLDAKAATCLGKQSASPLASERAEWNAAMLWSNGEHDAAIASIEKQIADADTTNATRERLSQWLLSMKAQK